MWTMIGRVALTGLVLSGLARSVQPGGLFPPDGVAGPAAEQTAPLSSTSTSTTSTTSTTTPALAVPTTAAPTTTTSPQAPSSAWPTPATTGATSPEAELVASSDCDIGPGEVVEGVVADCPDGLAIGDEATLRNAIVRSDGAPAIQSTGDGGRPAVLEDVTITPASGCGGEGIGWSNLQATRVEVVGFRDPFVSSDGDNLVIRDSYVKVCTGTYGWGAGLSGYPGGRDVVLDHNTIDARCHDWSTFVDDAFHPGTGNPEDKACSALATVFWNETSVAALTITDNLLRGGAYSIRLMAGSGHTVTGNVVERNSYAYGAVDGCARVATWSGNREADVGEDSVVSNETPFTCDPSSSDDTALPGSGTVSTTTDTTGSTNDPGRETDPGFE